MQYSIKIIKEIVESLFEHLNNEVINFIFPYFKRKKLAYQFFKENIEYFL